jgi:hypothetical protein
MRIDRLINVLEAFPGYTFDYGPDVELALDGNDSYPMLYLEEPILGTVDVVKFIHTLEFAVLLLYKEATKVSGSESSYKEDTPSIDSAIDDVKPLVSHLEANRYVVNSVGYVTLRDFGSDVVAGIRIELNITDTSKC